VYIGHAKDPAARWRLYSKGIAPGCPARMLPDVLKYQPYLDNFTHTILARNLPDRSVAVRAEADFIEKNSATDSKHGYNILERDGYTDPKFYAMLKHNTNPALQHAKATADTWRNRNVPT
jgi:hypothetical protein